MDEYSEEIENLTTESKINEDKFHDKDNKIQILEGKIRYITAESESKKKILENELSKYKQLVLNLQEELQNSGKNELIRELENRLSENEQELLKLREKELQNSKELMALKTQSISKSRVSMLARKSAIMDIIPIEKYNEIKNELEISKIQYEEIIIKIKETAVEAIMEKEKNILELKQKLETFESPDQYINSLKERIMIMEQENNKLENLLKEKQNDLEDEINKRIIIKSDEMNKVKSEEFEKLIECIHEQDEKITRYESQLKELTYNDEKLKKKLTFDLKDSEEKIEKLTEEKRILHETNSKLQQKLSLHDKDDQSQKTILQNGLLKTEEKLKTINYEKEEYLKKNQVLESENRRLTQLTTELKERILQSTTKISELEEKLDILSEQYSIAIKSLQKTPVNPKLSVDEKGNSYNNINQNLDPPIQESLLDSVNTPDLFEFMEVPENPRKEAKISFSSKEDDWLKYVSAQRKSLCSKTTRQTTTEPEPPLSTIEDRISESEFKLEIEDLESENNELKKCNDVLTNMNQKLISQIEDYQKREGELLNQMRKSRKSVIEIGIKKNENQDVKNLVEEIRIIETKFSEAKLNWLEQKIALENELRTTEKKAIDAKMKFADLITERDYYELEYRKIIKSIKMETPKNKNNKKIKSIFDVFVCH